MALPTEAIDRDVVTLFELIHSQVFTLDSFTANPTTAPPCGGQGVTLSWAIVAHPERAATSELRAAIPQVQFELDWGVIPIADVSRTGTRVVQQSITSHYTVVACLRQIKGALGPGLTVTVDETECRRISLSETYLRGLVQGSINETLGILMQETEIEASLRSPVSLQITSSGVMLNLRFRMRRNGNAGDVDINSRYQILVRNCHPYVLNQVGT